MFPTKDTCLAIVCLGIALAATGCSNNGMPEIGEVEGRVTLDGSPVPQCQVQFEPIAGGRSSHGTTDADGHYTLIYKANVEGALIGEHRVRISTYRRPLSNDRNQISDPGKKELIPKEYNVETNQIVEVTSSGDPINFEISSK